LEDVDFAGFDTFLRAGGFDHRKYGWVRTPAFEFVGKAPKASAGYSAAEWQLLSTDD
jgi:hypothetical protein